MAFDPIKAFLGSAVLCVIVLLIRMNKKMPAKTVCILWIFPMLRMCIPFSYDFGWSHSIGRMELFLDGQRILFDRYGFGNFKTILLIVWVVGMAVIAAAIAKEQILARRILKYATRIRGNVFRNEIDNSSFTVGIVRPAIVIGKRVDAVQEEYVLAHERAHVRYRDNLLRLITVLVSIVFWFNPFVWVIKSCLFCDMELRCDEKVIGSRDDSYKKNYAMTVLRCAFDADIESISEFSGNVFQKRIRHILTCSEGRSFWHNAAVSVVAAVFLLSFARYSGRETGVYVTRTEYALVQAETDRYEYGPGEPIVLTVTVTNTFDECIGILAGKNPDTGVLSTYAWLGSSYAGFIADSADPGEHLSLSLAPGESCELCVTFRQEYYKGADIVKAEAGVYSGAAYVTFFGPNTENTNENVHFYIRIRE